MMTETRHATSFASARVKTLVVVMFCYLFYYTGRQNFGFAIPGMAEEFGLTKAQLGWCSTALLWSYAIGQAINGQLADRFGGRSLMTLGGLLSFVMNWITSFAGGLAGVLVPWAGNGFVQSMGWAPGSRILSNWWDRGHRGRVFGFYTFAAGMSSVVTYCLAAVAVDHGWRWIFRGPVFLMLVGCAVFWLVIRERPSQAGFQDLLDEGDSAREQIHPERHLTWWERYKAGFACVPFLFGCAAIGFQNLARYGLLVWVPVHFLGEDWKDSPQKWVSVALPVGMAFGAISAGWISDRIFAGKRSTPVILFLGIAAICAGGMSMLDRTSMLALPLLFLTGFFVYGPQSAFWALCPDLLGKRLAGTGTGMMNFVAYLFAGLGEPLIGYLIESNDSTHMVFPVVAVACALGAILMSFIRKQA
ncbi:MFS transporter [Luteolibacter flavescens]|uniref:MFS transporter n=1 Tax=Luteolibacter flavescens TaxID=1859460 RepID=A0ABT3FUU7_9BACT|nr:MFS transporter [Luteolibacter flavescens]MCW1887368.1 MFS transporter [Luteolibacter flavescens]